MKAFVLLLACTTAGASVPSGIFSWPTNVALDGPYTLSSVISNATVFQPNGSAVTENDMATHRYSHHSRIDWYQGVTRIATSSGGVFEDSGGQQCVLYTSTNKGVSWSAPLQVIPSQSAWVTNQYIGRKTEPRNFTLYNGTNYLTCSVETNGTHGEALISCALYDDGTIGPLFLISTNPYPSMDGKSVPSYNSTLGPPLLADSELYGTHGGTFPGGEPWSDWVGFWYTGSSTPPQDPGLQSLYGEPSTFSIDGTASRLYRIWRGYSDATHDHSVHQSISENGGLSWQIPQPADWTFPQFTGIPNSGSDTAALRISDGRYAIIGNPLDNFVQCGVHGRDPLFLAITTTGSTNVTDVYAIRQGLAGDGTYYGENQIEGGAQYPHAVQVGNYLYVGYSIAKQRVGFSRVLVPGLPDNNNDVWPTPLTISATTVRVGTLRMAP